ncbi:MAG: DNA repair protein RecO [Muribaculaceae bacterium]|nr:DNA repair protein RecO [Muribaculaceae bacterium]
MAIEKITGIVVDTVRHNDRHNIVTLFTRSRGRIAFLSPVGSGKAGRMRNARLMPLSVVEADVNIRQNRELQSLGSIMPAEVWRNIYFNPVKSSIALFLSEFLNRYLRDSSPDHVAWDFILASLRILDNTDKGLANFHIWFLIRFLDIAGIAPDLSGYENGDAFDMRGGIPVVDEHIHKDILSPAETRLLVLLSRISVTNMRFFRFTGNDRRRLLDRILRYYAIHFPGLSGLKSPDVLSDVFA